MGGLRCAKEIIDNFAAVENQFNCMRASIHLAGEFDGSGLRPTYEQRDEFIAAADSLVKVMAGIQQYVSGRSEG
jgi:hypothetical protein